MRFLQVYFIFLNEQNKVVYRIGFPSGFITNLLITYFTRSFCFFFLFSYTIASSALSTNMFSPLVRDVEMDIMSSAFSAFIVLNLFYMVLFKPRLAYIIIHSCCQIPSHPHKLKNVNLSNILIFIIKYIFF